MNEKDDAILEYLAKVGVAEPPAVIHYNLTQESPDMHEVTLKRRLKRLRNLGLVEIVYEKGGYYSITSEGKSYLRGDLDASELED